MMREELETAIDHQHSQDTDAYCDSNPLDGEGPEASEDEY